MHWIISSFNDVFRFQYLPNSINWKPNNGCVQCAVHSLRRSLSHTHIDNSLSRPNNNRSFWFNLYTFCLQLPTSCLVYSTEKRFISRHKMQPIAETTTKWELYMAVGRSMSFQIYAKTCITNQFPSSSIYLCTLSGYSSSIHAS